MGGIVSENMHLQRVATKRKSSLHGALHGGGMIELHLTGWTRSDSFVSSLHELFGREEHMGTQNRMLGNQYEQTSFCFCFGRGRTTSNKKLHSHDLCIQSDSSRTAR